MQDRSGITRRTENQRFINPTNGRVFTIVSVFIPKVLGYTADTLKIRYEDNNTEATIKNRGDLIPVS